MQVTDVNIGMDIMQWIRKHEVKCPTITVEPQKQEAAASDMSAPPDTPITTCPACGQCSLVYRGPHMVDGHKKKVCAQCDDTYSKGNRPPNRSRCKSEYNQCFCNYEHAVSKNIVSSGVIRAGYCRRCYGRLAPTKAENNTDWQPRQYHKKCLQQKKQDFA